MEYNLFSTRAHNDKLEQALSSAAEKDTAMDTAARDQQHLQDEVAKLQANLEHLCGTLDEVVMEKNAADQTGISLRKELQKIQEQHDGMPEEMHHAFSQVEDNLQQTLHKTTSERDQAVKQEKLLQGELVQIKQEQEAVLDKVHHASAQAKDKLMDHLDATVAEQIEADQKLKSLQEDLNEAEAQHEVHLDEAHQEWDRAFLELEAQKKASEKLKQDY